MTHRNNFFKKSLLYAFLATLSSCSFFELMGWGEEFIQYQIRNNSDYDIKVQAFGNLRLITEFALKSNSDTSSYDSFSNPNRNNFFEETPDSIAVIFDGRRYLSQYCSGKNLFTNSDPECASIKKNLGNMYGIAPSQEVNKRIDGKMIVRKYYITFDNSDFETD